MRAWIPRVVIALLVCLFYAGWAGAAEGFFIFKSTDGAQSWERADAGLPGTTRINALGAAQDLLFAGTDGGLFVSSDEARRWRPGSGVAMTSGRILSLATSGRSVWAGTDGSGLLVSSDGGHSWAVERAFPSSKVRCLLLSFTHIFWKLCS
jgi:ligand-binding sensor domain-containing protein